MTEEISHGICKWWVLSHSEFRGVRDKISSKQAEPDELRLLVSKALRWNRESLLVSIDWQKWGCGAGEMVSTIVIDFIVVDEVDQCPSSGVSIIFTHHGNQFRRCWVATQTKCLEEFAFRTRRLIATFVYPLDDREAQGSKIILWLEELGDLVTLVGTGTGFLEWWTCLCSTDRKSVV